MGLLNAADKPFAGGFMPAYNRESTNGGYYDGFATAKYRKAWDKVLLSKLQWNNLATWNDTGEMTDIQPSSDWNHTRSDITAFYSAALRGTPFPKSTAELYITTAQHVRLGEVPVVEGLVINPTTEKFTVTVDVLDADGRSLGTRAVETVQGRSANAAFANFTVADIPTRRFLRAKATLIDSTGTVRQQVISAPILVYGTADQPASVLRRLYYSIPASRALPGTVGLRIEGTPTASTRVDAFVTPPPGTTVRFQEVIQNTKLVENIFEAVGQAIKVPMVNGKTIMGNAQDSAQPWGFYVARVIDSQERVGYSDPIYIAP